MERLQEALSRARESRAKATPTGGERRPEAGTAVSRARAQRVSAVSGGEVDAAWAALPALEVNEKHLTAHRVVSYFGGQEATSYDMLRTKLVQHAKSNGWRRIAITSPSPRCGKTTVTANLAFSLARQPDLRTLVVETDLRRPALARTLGHAEPHSFARVLSGQDNAADHMVRFGDNVAFATNHVATPNPAELLQSAMVKSTLTDLETTYAPDLVLFDTAPLLASDDTIGFLENVDAALLIVAAELTTMDEVDVSESELAEVTQVMGVVLNKSRYSGSRYGGYEYGYY